MKKIRGKYGFRVIVIFEDLKQKECLHSGFEKKSEAEKERDQVVALLHSKKYIIYKNVKLEELLTYWLEYVMRVKPGFTSNSYDTYMRCIKNHIVPQIGKLALMKLNQGHIMKFYKELVSKYKSIPRIAKPILNTSLEFAVSKNLITYNPCEDIILPAINQKTLYHEIVIDEAKTYTLQQVKPLLKESKNSKIHMQIVFALLMGLRKSEIHGLKYSDIDYDSRRLRISRQLGRDPNKNPDELPPKTRTKQEIPPKTNSSYRWIDIPDYVYYEIIEERKRYERNRTRRQSGRWVFQDLDYICCSSYGKPRSLSYIYVPYKELIDSVGLPYIRFHDLRHPYVKVTTKFITNYKILYLITALIIFSNPLLLAIISSDIYFTRKSLIVILE